MKYLRHIANRNNLGVEISMESLDPNLKVLTVDDSATIRKMVIKMLRESGFAGTVDEAEDGVIAMKMINEKSYGLVLMDWTMPRMSGVEALKTIRSGAATKHLPVIMLTAEGLENNITVAAKAGASGYVTKPFTMERLIDAISRALKSQKTHTPIVWSEKYSVGVRFFDDQHKELFMLTDSLVNAIVSKAPAKIVDELFDELILYAKMHFKDEERMMSANRYNLMETHRQEHKNLLQLLSEFKTVVDANMAQNSDTDIAFLENWLKSHICDADMLYEGKLKESHTLNLG